MANALHQKRGSNLFAVNGSHSKSGHSIFCNDPHLPLLTPSFWFAPSLPLLLHFIYLVVFRYEIHLQSEDGYHSTGVSIAGSPLNIIGHSANMVWVIILYFSWVRIRG